MTETKIGRPPRKVPRRQRHLYMTDAVYQKVQNFRDREAARKNECSFSDAIERMVDIASNSVLEAKLQPAVEVFGALPGAETPDWIKVDTNNGQRVRCSVCSESHNVEATRFSDVIKEIAEFVGTHSECGDAGTQETGS